MVQPQFSTGGPSKEAEGVSATAVLDDFLDRQHQSYYEELYDSEAACLCLLRYVARRGGHPTGGASATSRLAS